MTGPRRHGNRVAVALLCLTALVAAGLVQHADHPASSRVFESATVAAAAIHAAQAPHFEPSGLVERPGCTTCLLQHERPQPRRPAPATREAAPPQSAGRPADQVPADGRVARLPRFRAPPLS